MIRFIAITLLSVAFGISVGLVPARSAPQISDDGTALSFDLAGHRVTTPRPAWVGRSADAETVAAQSLTFHKVIEDSVELHEFVPVTETFDDWTQFSGVLAVGKDGHTVQHVEQSLIAPFQAGCRQGSLVAERVPPMADDAKPALLIACGSFQGAENEMGEVLLAVVLQSPHGAVKIYEEYRGPAFDIENTDNWPISRMELLLRLSMLQGYASFEPIDR